MNYKIFLTNPKELSVNCWDDKTLVGVANAKGDRYASGRVGLRSLFSLTNQALAIGRSSMHLLGFTGIRFPVTSFVDRILKARLVEKMTQRVAKSCQQ